jgi:hypothetical protein
MIVVVVCHASDPCLQLLVLRTFGRYTGGTDPAVLQMVEYRR